MAKIVSFKAENFKKLEAIEIHPEDFNDVVILSGKNRQGKSSVIEALWAVLESFKFAKPINTNKAEDDPSYVEIQLEDLIIKRHWTSNDKSYLNVLTLDGAKYPSPQAMIDKLKGAIALDPVEFIMLGQLNDGQKKQVEYLIKALKLNTKTIDMKVKVLYDERMDINRELNRYKALLKELPEPEVNLPDEEISVSELNQKYQDAIKNNSDIDLLKKEAIRFKDIAINRDNEANRTQKDIEALEKQLVELKKRKEAYLIEKREYEKRAIEQELKVKELAYIDESLIQNEIAKADEVNKKIRSRDNRVKLENERDDLFAKSEQKTGEIEELKKQKQEQIKATQFSIEGLTYTDEGVFVNDIPFNQLSESEQFEFSTLISMAANPELKVIATKHGNIFDDERMQILINLAKDKEYQIWIEKIQENVLPSIIIEEGKIKSIKNKKS